MEIVIKILIIIMIIIMIVIVIIIVINMLSKLCDTSNGECNIPRVSKT